MIGHCRDLDLLSTIAILFSISGSELFVVDMNVAAENTDIVILLPILLGLLM